LYKCYACGKQFLGGFRVSGTQLWEEYHKGKQTYQQLANKYGCSLRTIQRKIDAISVSMNKLFPMVVNVLMDTTYFGHHLGVMLFKDSLSGSVLYKRYVKTETTKVYLQGIAEIVRRGISVQAIICDGRKGVMQAFSDLPVQMCQFHQVQIVTRYLTRNPKTDAGKELRHIALLLVHSSQAQFTLLLDNWIAKWEAFLKERSEDKSKSTYTHKRLRSAYFSLRRNLPYLFTFELYKALDIPNTTNAIDGTFADLKNKLRCHNGLNLVRKKRFIDEFFQV
jgi:hypothetical protein